MLTSMTGFGRAFVDAPTGRFTVEVHSINKKHLDVFVSLPKELIRFEPEVRKWVAETVSRGQISVRVALVSSGSSVPDVAMLKELKKSWEQIARKVGIGPEEITLSFLMERLPARIETAKEGEEEPLHQAVSKALKSLLEMKRKEGSALARDLTKRLKLLEKMVAEIEKHAPDATARMRDRLREKISEVSQIGPEVEERLLREVALFAERVDVTEEITRFRSHIEQFKETLKGSSVGRKMDFLIQEMGREVNTIGSKSMEAKISRLVIEMKSELEKMREQVQNIE